MKKIWTFIKDEDGLELSEYAVMAFLIVTVVVGTIIALGERIDVIFNDLLVALGGGGGGEG